MLARLRQLDAYGWARALVLAGMLASLSTSTYYLLRGVATDKVIHKFDYDAKKLASMKKVRPEFRPRIASIALVSAIHEKDDAKMASQIGAYFAFGFLATCALYLLLDVRATPLLALGTFASLYYCTTPQGENTWYPWDVPSLFFGAATLVLAVRRSVLLLALTILVAVAFKETVLLMALFFLFYEGRSLRWRASWTGGVLAAGVVLRSLIERAVGGAVKHGAFLHVHGKPDREYRVLDNMRYLFSHSINHVLFVHVGLFLLVFAIPTRDRVLAGFKWIVLAFYAGQLLAGSYNEFRIFLEVLPGSLLLLYHLFYGESGRVQPS